MAGSSPSALDQFGLDGLVEKLQEALVAHVLLASGIFDEYSRQLSCFGRVSKGKSN